MSYISALSNLAQDPRVQVVVGIGILTGLFFRCIYPVEQHGMNNRQGALIPVDDNEEVEEEFLFVGGEPVIIGHIAVRQGERIAIIPVVVRNDERVLAFFSVILGRMFGHV